MKTGPKELCTYSFKTKNRLNRNLKTLEKKRESICYEMDVDYEVIKCKLMDCYKAQQDFKEAIRKTKVKRKFKKALAKKLDVEYAFIKDRLPIGLNSTTIANFLDPYLDHLNRHEIRRICQKVKLEFDIFM